jgi:hypothetical protein
MNDKTKVLGFGGVGGALVGLATAYLFLQQVPVDEKGLSKVPSVQPSDAIKVGLGVVTAIRGIVDLGRK